MGKKISNLIFNVLLFTQFEVSRFFSAVLDGDCKQLRYVVRSLTIYFMRLCVHNMPPGCLITIIYRVVCLMSPDFSYQDVSNKDGLSAHADWNERRFSLRYQNAMLNLLTKVNCSFLALHTFFFPPFKLLFFPPLNCCSTIPISRLSKERPEICLIAKFPSEGRSLSLSLSKV